MQGVFYRKEENQCYYCFYGISLSVGSEFSTAMCLPEVMVNINAVRVFHSG